MGVWVVNVEKMKRLAAMMRDCKTVYCVYVSCEGEDTIEAIWDDEVIAKKDRDYYNAMKPRYGTARVVPMQIRTVEIGRVLYPEVVTT